MEQEPRPETVEFILEYTSDACERQLKDVDSLDSKVAQLFAVASVVIGLVGIGDLPSSSTRAATALLVVGLVFYALTALLCFAALTLREFHRASHADRLWPEYWAMKPMELRHILVHKIANAYVHNKKLLEEKGGKAQLALVFCMFEVFFVGVALIASRLGSPPPPPRITTSGFGSAGGGGGDDPAEPGLGPLGSSTCIRYLLSPLLGPPSPFVAVSGGGSAGGGGGPGGGGGGGSLGCSVLIPHSPRTV